MRVVVDANIAFRALARGRGDLRTRLAFIREAEISVGTWAEAIRLTKDVDPKDAPYVALTLHLDAKLWTLDAELKQGLRAKGFDQFWEQ